MTNGSSRRDFAPAQRTILALHGAGELNEAALLGFARTTNTGIGCRAVGDGGGKIATPTA
jgi:hypothetical protein